MLKKAYLDDVRETPSGFDIRWYSFYDAGNWMEEKGCPSFISFDHDLGPDDSNGYSFKTAPTGFDLVKWMVNKDLEMNGEFIPKDFDFAVHSANPTGAKNISCYLQQYLEQRSSS